MSVFVLHSNLHVAQFYLSTTSNILKCNSVMLSLSVNHFNLKFEEKKHSNEENYKYDFDSF